MNIVVSVIVILFNIALFINALLFLPQSYRIYKLKSAKSVSLFTYVGFAILQIICIAYGIVKDDWSIILGFGFAFICCSSIVVLAIYYRNK